MARIAKVDDIRKIVPLYNNYRDYFGYPNLNHKYEEFLKKMILDKHSDILILEENNLIQGFCIFNITTSSYYLGTSVWVIDLWIEKKLRGLGGVNELLDELKKYASSIGALSISFVTWDKLEKLCRFYERKGFNLEPLDFYRMVIK